VHEDPVSAFSISRVFPGLRHVTALACVWEAYAIWRHGWTFSRLAQRYPWLAPLMIGALSLHLMMLRELPERMDERP